MVQVLSIPVPHYASPALDEAVHRAFHELGAVPPAGARILLKPNLLFAARPERAITTHPALVEAVCRFLRDLRCAIVIADSSATFQDHGTLAAFRESGIEAAARRCGAELAAFEASPLLTLTNPAGRVWKKITVSSLLADCDGIINLPKLKTHSLVKYTGAVKNLYGCLPGGLKLKGHAEAHRPERFAELLIDLYQTIRDRILLHILDAVVALEGEGPGARGSPVQLGRILASTDGLALDLVATRMIGYEPHAIPTNKSGLRRGLTPSTPPQVCGDAACVSFRKPRTFLGWSRDSWFARLCGSQPWVYRLLRSEPKLLPHRCRACGLCAEACPAHAIQIDELPRFQRDACIHCYCCHEICPAGAIALEKHPLIRILRRARRRPRLRRTQA